MEVVDAPLKIGEPIGLLSIVHFEYSLGACSPSIAYTSLSNVTLYLIGNRLEEYLPHFVKIQATEHSNYLLLLPQSILIKCEQLFLLPIWLNQNAFSQIFWESTMGEDETQVRKY